MVVAPSTTIWVDPARLATTRQQLLNILAQIDANRSQLNGSSVGPTSMLRCTITDELIPAITRILDFDGWHRWETSHVLQHLPSSAAIVRFGTDRAELMTLARHITQGAFGDNLIRAFATHLSQREIDLGFAASNLYHPGSDWALLVQRASSTTSLPIAQLLAAVVTNDRSNTLAQSLADSARSDHNVAQLLKRVTPQLGDRALQSILITLTSPEGTHRIPGVDPVAEQIALDAVLANVAGRPEVARIMTDDSARLARVVTNPFLDPHAVERAGRAGMLITGASPMLRHLVAIRHQHGELTPGGIRLAATALISDLDEIAPTIDLPVVRSTGPHGAIDIGTREELRPLVADMLNDLPAQTAIGLALYDIRETRIARALAASASHPEVDLTSTLAGQLTDISDLSRTFDHAAKTAHDAERLRRSQLFGGIDLALSVSGRVAIVAAPAIGGATAIALTGSRELIGVINAVTADDTPPEAITEVVNMATTVSVLRHVAENLDIRNSLHIANIDAEFWSDLTSLIQEFNSATSGVEKARSYGDIVLLCSESIELTTFVNEIQALSNNR